jgi:hypothetical protein
MDQWDKERRQIMTPPGSSELHPSDSDDSGVLDFDRLDDEDGDNEQEELVDPTPREGNSAGKKATTVCTA